MVKNLPQRKLHLRSSYQSFLVCCGAKSKNSGQVFLSFSSFSFFGKEYKINQTKNTPELEKDFLSRAV